MTLLTVKSSRHSGGEKPQLNQEVSFNPTIHYILYEIVEKRTKEYPEK